MPTTALYHWSVAGSPVDILLDLPLVDRLRMTCSHPTAEVGGILIGHFDGNYTVITDFEAIESEHRRGTAYSLSGRDEQRLSARIEVRSKRHRGEVVGMFRSHLRPGLFLDEADNSLVSSHFNDPRETVLLIKPASDGTATGGFFFWEDGEMNRKQSYLPFPMNSHELEAGDFPLVEPVSDTGYGPAPHNFDTAETVETLSAAAVLAHSQAEANRTAISGAAASAVTQAAGSPVSRGRAWNWPMIGLIAAGAALGGYILGTNGTNHDRFGSRPGDITVGADGPQSGATTSQVSTKAPEKQPVALRTPATAPVTASSPAAADNDRPSPMPVKQQPVTIAARDAIATLVIPPPEPPPGVKPQTPAPDSTAQAEIPAAQPQPSYPPAASQTRWNHFGDSPGAPVSSTTTPQPAAVPNTTAAAGDGSVYLEAVEEGGLRQALHRIPLIGRSRNDDFVPPQAVRSFAPKVPSDLAREITSTQAVDLKLKVDNTGRVTSVELLSRGTPPDFVRLAGDAAYDWRFEPAHIRDKAVSSEVIAHFRFRASSY
jgi:hypothetical protein